MRKSSSRSNSRRSSRSYFWVPSARDSFPVNAVEGGCTNGHKTFVARASHERCLVPGSFSVPERTTFIAWNGKEYSKFNYEILVAPNETVQWIPYDWRSGPVPINSVVGGHSDIFKEPLYIGRCKYTEHVITSSSSGIVQNVLIGSIQPSRKACFVPYDGKVLAFHNSCEILVEI